MKILKNSLMGISCLMLLMFSSGCMPHSTGSTEVGIRVKKLTFGKKGVEDKIYAPGAVYFFLPLINDWYTFDTKLQNLEMTINPIRGDQKGSDDLLFKTIDGNDISLDVIIAYKIDPTKAPYILENIATSDKALKDNVVRVVARSKPRDIFGELTTEDFYNAAKRSKKADEVMDNLNKILNPYGIIVEKVLTKDYRFNKEYQDAIEDKKVADQVAQQNKSAANAALEEYKKDLETAQGEVNKVIAQIDGAYMKAKIKADAYLEQQQKISEAIESEGKADAEAILKMNEALFGVGGTTMVKLKIAESLNGKRIVLLPFNDGSLDFRKTDVNQLIDVYGINKIAEE